MPYIHVTQFHNGLHTEHCVLDIETLKDYPYYGKGIPTRMYIICARCKEVDCEVDSRRVLPYIDGVHLQCPLVLCDICHRNNQLDILI